MGAGWAQMPKAMIELASIELALILAVPLLAFGVYELFIVAPLRRKLAQLDRAMAGLRYSVQQANRLDPRLEAHEAAVNERLGRIADRIGQIELRSESRALEHAIDQAARGNAERLVKNFGLTEGEASLVCLLHGGTEDNSTSAETS